MNETEPAGAAPRRVRPLTARREAFCREVVKGETPTNAYRLASQGRVNDRTAWQRSCVWMRDPRIEARIAQLKDEAAERAVVTATQVLTELKCIAFSDMRRFVSWGPGGVTLKDAAGLTDEEAAAVAEVWQAKGGTDGRLGVKLHDKLRALHKLARYLGLFAEKHDHDGDKGRPIELTVISHIEPGPKEP